MNRASNVADILVTVLAGVFVVYGAYLVVLGPLITLTAPDSNLAVLMRTPNLVGVVPAAAGVFVWYGQRRGERLLAWLGATVSLGFSILFLLGVGGVMIPVAVALILALALSARLGLVGGRA